MADRILKPDSGNDLVLQNDDASAKIEINEDGSMPVTGTLEGNMTVGSGKTLNVSSGNFTTSSAQKQAIVQAGPGSGTLDVSSGTFTTSSAQKQAIVDGSVIEAQDLASGSGTTLPNNVQDAITRLGTVTSGTISTTVSASSGASLVLLEKFTANTDGNADELSKDFDFTAYTTYSEYLFVLNGWLPVSNGADLNVYLGSDNGSGGTTYASNTNDYRVPIRRWYYGGSGNVLTNVDDSVNTMFAFASSVNSSSNYPGVNGHMSVFVPRSSNKFTGNVFDTVSWTSNDNIYKYQGGGWRRQQLDNTHIRFVWSTGNLLGGSIIMYGVKDA